MLRRITARTRIMVGHWQPGQFAVVLLVAVLVESALFWGHGELARRADRLYAGADSFCDYHQEQLENGGYIQNGTLDTARMNTNFVYCLARRTADNGATARDVGQPILSLAMFLTLVATLFIAWHWSARNQGARPEQ